MSQLCSLHHYFPFYFQIELKDVQKLSILTKPELVSICKRNNISVTGEKQALAARILRKLGKIFDDDESPAM